MNDLLDKIEKEFPILKLDLTNEGYNYEQVIRTIAEFTQVEYFNLILSLQKQVEDLRKNARDYARKDYAKELAEDVKKMKPEEFVTVSEMRMWNKAINRIINLLTKEQKIDK